MIDNDISKVLFSEEDIKKRVKELALKISSDYAGEKFLLVGILKGAFVFISDLARNIKEKCSVDFIVASSYGLASTTTSGKVKLLKDVSVPIEGKNVIIVEDILDTGITLDFVFKYFLLKKPKSLNICTFLNKPARRKIEVKAKYIGFDIPNEFVVGYGMDYNEDYRNLPYIGILSEKVWKIEG